MISYAEAAPSVFFLDPYEVNSIIILFTDVKIKEQRQTNNLVQITQFKHNVTSNNKRTHIPGRLETKISEYT